MARLTVYCGSAALTKEPGEVCQGESATNLQQMSRQERPARIGLCRTNHAGCIGRYLFRII